MPTRPSPQPHSMLQACPPFIHEGSGDAAVGLHVPAFGAFAEGFGGREDFAEDDGGLGGLGVGEVDAHADIALAVSRGCSGSLWSGGLAFGRRRGGQLVDAGLGLPATARRGCLLRAGVARAIFDDGGRLAEMTLLT